jgi:hypothetical protein
LIGRLRAALETAVREQSGEVSIVAAATIQSAVRHETVALLAARWLRQRAEAMTDADRLNYARAIAAASDARDKCIKTLGIERSKADVWAAIYQRPTHSALVLTNPPHAAPSASHKGNGTAADSEGTSDAAAPSAGDTCDLGANTTKGPEQ